jgi:hypothetical protein
VVLYRCVLDTGQLRQSIRGGAGNIITLWL